MQLQRETFEYHDDLIHVSITVRQVSLAESMERDAMRAEADLPPTTVPKEELQAVIVERGHLIWTWPNCISGTVSIENLEDAVEELSLDELRKDKELFFSLPYSLVSLWEDSIVGLNPNFSPFWSARRRKSKEKDESGSNSNSSNGT